MLVGQAPRQALSAPQMDRSSSQSPRLPARRSRARSPSGRGGSTGGLRRSRRRGRSRPGRPPAAHRCRGGRGCCRAGAAPAPAGSAGLRPARSSSRSPRCPSRCSPARPRRRCAGSTSGRRRSPRRGRSLPGRPAGSGPTGRGCCRARGGPGSRGSAGWGLGWGPCATRCTSARRRRSRSPAASPRSGPPCRGESTYRGTRRRSRGR
mmetsp:Transcript_30052/g.89162  ORF Transcript_30052/g.89162 Transcript_30052/m.89162 type:complete len:207 (+) Transcript_30052:209-829(+)